jgi:hypothetical protein
MVFKYWRRSEFGLMDDFKLLFSTRYFDHPLAGLGLWKGEKVYFDIDTDTERWWFRQPGSVGDDTTAQDPEWDPLTQDFAPEIVTFINAHLADEIDTRIGKMIISINDATIELEQVPSYNLYRVSSEILDAMEHNQTLFNRLYAEKAADDHLEWYEKYTTQKISYTLDLSQFETIGHM